MAVIYHVDFTLLDLEFCPIREARYRISLPTCVVTIYMDNTGIG